MYICIYIIYCLLLFIVYYLLFIITKKGSLNQALKTKKREGEGEGGGEKAYLRNELTASTTFTAPDRAWRPTNNATFASCWG